MAFRLCCFKFKIKYSLYSFKLCGVFFCGKDIMLTIWRMRMKKIPNHYILHSYMADDFIQSNLDCIQGRFSIYLSIYLSIRPSVHPSIHPSSIDPSIHLSVFALLGNQNHDLGIASVMLCSCGSVVEHCVSCAKGCGFDSQGTQILMKMYSLNAL